VKAHVGISVQVRVHDPGSLQRSEGKARRVVDRRKAT
jgi:phenylacetate-coenzyme A ligase PaaK-like adenylate-forming protein